MKPLARSLLLPLALAAACATSRPPAPPAQPPAPVVAAASQPAPPAAPAPDRSTAPEKGPPPALHVPPEEHLALSNGLRVRLVESHRLPIVAVYLVADAGAAHDPAGAAGLASLTAEMMTEGTTTRTATRISDEVGSIGASLDAVAGFDSAALVGASLSRHLPKLLDVLADVAMHPTFPKADFTRVQDDRIVSLLQQRDVPQAMAGKAFAGAFWGKHPYGHWSSGTEASVKAMRPAELARFHARYWTPARAELIVVGDVTAAALRAALEPTLGTWRTKGEAAALPPAPPAAPMRTIVVAKPGAPQSFLELGMPGLSRASPDYVAAQVAFEILGGGTLASRLNRELREVKGYTYGIYARPDARRLGGSSVIVGSVKAEQTGAALKDLLAEVDRIREQPVPDGELEDAKNALVLGLPADFSTVRGIAGKVADLVVNGLPDDYWDRFAGAVRAVTAADVQRVARAYLDPKRLTLVMVANPDVVAPQLAGLPIGPVEVQAPPAPPTAPALLRRTPVPVRPPARGR